MIAPLLAPWCRELLAHRRTGSWRPEQIVQILRTVHEPKLVTKAESNSFWPAKYALAASTRRHGGAWFDQHYCKTLDVPAWVWAGPRSEDF